MASILKVDSMQGVTSAGDITITSEGGSATQSLQQGLAKHWINLDGDAGTPAALDSLNTSSISDNGTGIYAYNFASNMGSTNYCVQGTAAQIPTATSSGVGHEPRTGHSVAYSTNFIECNTYYVDSSNDRTLADFSNSNCTVHGDLA